MVAHLLTAKIKKKRNKKLISNVLKEEINNNDLRGDGRTYWV